VSETQNQDRWVQAITTTKPGPRRKTVKKTTQKGGKSLTMARHREAETGYFHRKKISGTLGKGGQFEQPVRGSTGMRRRKTFSGMPLKKRNNLQ